MGSFTSEAIDIKTENEKFLLCNSDIRLKGFGLSKSTPFTLMPTPKALSPKQYYSKVLKVRWWYELKRLAGGNTIQSLTNAIPMHIL